MMNCPLCNSKLEKIDGLEGMFCTQCDFHTDTEPSKTTKMYEYNEDRLRKLRGVPHHTLCMGSETKGRINVMIPTDATEEESKAIIDFSIDMLKYMQNRIKEEGLDIFTIRGKKNE